MKEKPAGYFEQDRAELVRLLPRPLGRVLDVGPAEVAWRRSGGRTRSRLDLVALLKSTAWSVDGISFGALRPVSRAAARLTRGRSPEFLAYQLSALAHRP